MPIAKHSFIQMEKLSNVKGRITYISSKSKQENLYAVYQTTERKFFRELAKCNQEEFEQSGTKGTCIEARELIIALPKSFVEYDHDLLLKLFTEHFKQTYGTECISALHHNKRKTNFHIHLIFSERKLLDKPIEKIATRNMFYDENGKHVRTKKEICNEDGSIRDGCHIIKKGEVYERKLFGIKDTRFKSEQFLDEVKHSYTDLINLYVRNDTEKLKVFERGGVYLSTKKIGKNNPKAEQIEADNGKRQAWNHAVDRALVGGVPEQQILAIKKSEISDKVRVDIAKNGKQPEKFASLIVMAIAVLELLMKQVFKRMYQPKDEVISEDENKAAQPQKENVLERVEEQKQIRMQETEKAPEAPKKSALAEKYPRLSEVYDKLNQQNKAIYYKEQQLENVQTELVNTKGLFKGKQRKELQQQISQLESQIESMKKRLSGIVQEYGYKTVKGFMAEYKASKAEYNDYQSALAKWEKQTGNKEETNSIRAKLSAYKEQAQEQKRQYTQKKDRGAR